MFISTVRLIRTGSTNNQEFYFHVQHFIVYFQKSEDLRNQWNLYFVLSWIVSFHAVEKTT